MSAAAPAGLLPVAEALARILAGARPGAVEQVPVEMADGRVLAADLAARRTQPPADLSAMDGFALRAADTDPPGRALRVIGESAAGHAFAGTLGPGEAVRIYTGAILPAGADAVLMQEQAKTVTDDTGSESVRSTIPLASGAFIRRRGRDFSAGTVHLRAGTRLDPGRIALAGAMDHAEIPVFRRPRIAILATGDELVRPGAGGPEGTIVASNGFAIAAMARRAGAEILDLGIVPDRRAAITAGFDRAGAWPADALVTIGGASVGRHDLVRHVAAECGARLDFFRIAMRPGKPLNFGTLGPMLLLGLPGNPVSALVCAHLFLMPLIAALQGDAAAGAPAEEPAILGAPLPANDLRADYLRARLARDAAGRLVATPAADQDSSLLTVYAEAEALILRAPGAPAAAGGDPCRILRLAR
ncbi:gephyrin-like molybdotransferase Glp [Rhabdaerophilum calidifontis]|uniref:molybdopterin molybdotransferase MoeA n=1 Tax=Rhabdaerophilum calidifontis TaxID=2604328 RepID=UPI001FE9D06B|nr:gephyrin-like molybdotransferase Glp [Rhabdaerophilum calidifontis]